MWISAIELSDGVDGKVWIYMCCLSTISAIVQAHFMQSIVNNSERKKRIEWTNAKAAANRKPSKIKDKNMIECWQFNKALNRSR